MIVRVVGSWRWVTIEVNCLLNLLAIDWALVRVLFPNLMGWFGGRLEFFPFSFLMRRQNFLRLNLWFVVESSVTQVWLASLSVAVLIWAFRVPIAGSVGFDWRRLSRWLVRLRISGVRPGT